MSGADAGGRGRAGVLGAALGVAAAGVAAGVAATVTARRLLRRSRQEETDPHRGETFGLATYDRARRVTTPDGVDLYVEVVEPVVPADTGDGVPPERPARPTVVFVHGFCLDLGVFHFQRRELARLGEWRAVYYDQPGHGRSGRLPPGEYRLPALADALNSLLDEVVGDQPVVLVGHSMGGMTVLAFAERYPERFAGQVTGVVLIATAAGGLAAGGTNLPDLAMRVGRPLLPLVDNTSRVTGPVIEQGRRAARQLARLLTRRYAFGGPEPSPALVAYVERLNSATPIETVARFLRTLYDHARFPELAGLRAKPVLLVCGDRDQIVPPAHTRRVKEQLPAAELVVVPDSGHMVLLEHHEEVTGVIVDFLERLP